MNERPTLLPVVQKILSETLSNLNTIGSPEDIPTEATYDDLLETTQRLITAVQFLTDELKTMAEGLDLPEPGPIAGAEGKLRLGLDHTYKNRIASMVLISARQILCSHYDTVHPYAEAIADICHEVIEQNN